MCFGFYLDGGVNEDGSENSFDERNGVSLSAQNALCEKEDDLLHDISSAAFEEALKARESIASSCLLTLHVVWFRHVVSVSSELQQKELSTSSTACHSQNSLRPQNVLDRTLYVLNMS